MEKIKNISIILTNKQYVLSLGCYVLLNFHRSLPIGTSDGSPRLTGSRV